MDAKKTSQTLHRQAYIALICFTFFYTINLIMGRKKIYFAQTLPDLISNKPAYTSRIQDLLTELNQKNPGWEQELPDTFDIDRLKCPITRDVKRDPFRGRRGGKGYQGQEVQRLIQGSDNPSFPLSPISRQPWQFTPVRSPHQATFIQQTLTQILNRQKQRARQAQQKQGQRKQGQQKQGQRQVQMVNRYSALPLQSPRT